MSNAEESKGYEILAFPDAAFKKEPSEEAKKLAGKIQDDVLGLFHNRSADLYFQMLPIIDSALREAQKAQAEKDANVCRTRASAHKSTQSKQQANEAEACEQTIRYEAGLEPSPIYEVRP